MAETIVLPDDVAAWARAKVAAGEAETLEAAISALVRAERDAESWDHIYTEAELAHFAKLGAEADTGETVSVEEVSEIFARMGVKWPR